MEFTGITLVTGAAGFMGGHLVELLAGKGVRVRATARPRKDTSFFDKLGVEFVGADLRQPETLPHLFRGNVDRVFHMGAICNFSTPYEELYPVNVRGVEHITKLAMEAKVKRYVHVGSTSVYAPSRGTPMGEDYPQEPQNSYGKSKHNGEQVVRRRIQEGLPGIITRPCTVYGPRCTDGAGKAFSRPTSITAIPGNGRQRLSNVRAEDVAAAVFHLSRIDGIEGQAYNIADNSNPTVGEALVLASKAFGMKPPVLHIPLSIVKIAAKADGMISKWKGKIPDLEYDAVNYLYEDYIIDNTKLKKTGFQFIYPDFTASMEQIGRWYREPKRS